MYDDIVRCLKNNYANRPNMDVPSFSGEGVAEVQRISEAYINLTLVNFSEAPQQNAPNGLLGSLAESEAEVDASFHRRPPVALESLLSQRGKKGQVAKRLLVTGRAGIGKSTLCHRIAYEWSQGRLWPDVPVVIWLSLKTIQKYEHRPELSLAEWLYYEYFQNSRMSVETIQQWIVDIPPGDKSDCLFLLDGFDEVTYLVDRSNVLKTVLALPFAIVTTRPYARPDRDANVQFDVQVENMGFTNRDVTAYITRRFQNYPETGKALNNYLNRNFTIRTACYIPLNLFLLASLWAQKQQYEEQHGQMNLADDLSFTQFYREFIKAFLHAYVLKSNRFSAEEKATSHDWTLAQLEAHFPDELLALERIAFEQLTTTQQLIIPLEKMNNILMGIDKKLTVAVLREMGFLKPVHSERSNTLSSAYYFVHLTFQEFFAARFIARKVNARDEAMLQFVAEQKYHPRYTVMMQFVAGLVFSNQEVSEETKKAKTYLWDALLSHEIDLVGLRHGELIILALEESCGAGLSEDLLKKIDDDIWQWVVFSYNHHEDSNQTPSTKKLREKARENLSRALSLSPHVAQTILEKFQQQWSTLETRQKTTILKYYVAEWVTSLPSASAFLLDELSNDQLAAAQREALFQDVPWERLRETPVKNNLRQKLLQLLTTLINPIKDENLSFLGLVLDALSLLVDDEEKDEQFKAVLINLLCTLSEQFVESKEHLKLSLAMLQDRLNRETNAIVYFGEMLKYPENNITKKQFEDVIQHTELLSKCHPEYKQTLREQLRNKLQQFATENRPFTRVIAVQLKKMGDTSPEILQYDWESTSGKDHDQVSDLIKQKIDVLQGLLTKATQEASKQKIALIKGMAGLIVGMREVLVSDFADVLLKVVTKDKDRNVRIVAIDVLAKVLNSVSIYFYDELYGRRLLETAVNENDKLLCLAFLELLVVYCGSNCSYKIRDLIISKINSHLIAARKYKELNLLLNVIQIIDNAINGLGFKPPLDLQESMINFLMWLAAGYWAEPAARVAAVRTLENATKRMESDLLSKVFTGLLKAAAEVNEDKYSEVGRAAIKALGNAYSLTPSELRISVDYRIDFELSEQHEQILSRMRLCDEIFSSDEFYSNCEKISLQIPRTVIDVLSSKVRNYLVYNSYNLNAFDELFEQADIDLNPCMINSLLKVAVGNNGVRLRLLAIWALSKILTTEAEGISTKTVANTFLKIALEDHSHLVQVFVISLLIKFYHEYLVSDLVPVLLKVAEGGQHKEVRQIAIEAVVKLSGETLLSDVVSVLLKVAEADQHEEVRQVAIQALFMKAPFFIRRPSFYEILDYISFDFDRIPSGLLLDVINCLMKVALEDKQEKLRQLAIEALGVVASQALNPRVIAVLLKVAAEDKSSHVYFAAMRAIHNAKKEDCSIVDYEKLLCLTKDDGDIFISFASIYCLNKIKIIKAVELNKHSIQLLFSQLSSNEETAVFSALQQLQAFKANADASTLLVSLLLGLLWEDKKRQAQISQLFFSLNVSLEELTKAYQQFFQNPETNKPALLQQRLDYFLLPLVEQLVCEGFTLKGCKNKPGLYVTLYDGKTVELLGEKFAPAIATTILQLTKQQLKRLGLEVQPHRELMKAALPRYLQRSSIGFFSGARLATWQQAFPLLPAITQNQAVAANRSGSLHPQLISGNPWSPKFPNSNLAIKLFTFAPRRAFKLEPDGHKKISTEVLRRAINEQMPEATEYLDLSGCGLGDDVADTLSACQNSLQKLRVLKLSGNCITREGLTKLLELAQQLKHLHYLFLDHNHNVFDDVYCERTLKVQLDRTHLVHLDLTMNFIQNGRLLEDANNHRTLSDEESRSQVPPDSFFFCSNFISQSLVVHSSYHGARVKSILNPEKKISPEKGVVALLAYKNRGINPFKEHALLAIETLKAEFGQRVLMIADLVNPGENRISVRLYRISPEDFLRNFSERTHQRAAEIEHGLIQNLVEKILESKDRQDFYDYELMADPDKQGAYNCLKWAYEQLRVIDVAREQEHWLPSWDVKTNQRCMVS